MEYLQYVLERQRAALMALLLGETETERSESRNEALRLPPEGETGQFTSGGTLGRELTELFRMPMAAGWAAEGGPENAGGSADIWTGRTGGGGSRRKGGVLTEGRNRQRSGGTGAPLTETVPANRQSGAETGGRTPVRMGRGSGGVWTAPAAGPGEWGEGSAGRNGGLWPAGGTLSEAESSARALSLAVQRDARRYDGGFAMY